MRNMIEKFHDTLYDVTDIPDEFIWTSAYYIISATVGEFYILKDVGIKEYPHIWAILAGDPGHTRKTSLLDSVIYPIYNNVMHEGSTIELGSPEGVTDKISDTNLPSYTLHGSELGRLFKGMYSESNYIWGMSAVLSKLYSRQEETWELVQGTRHLPGDKYVTMLGGIQNPNTYLGPEIASQGLLRRIVFVVPSKNVRDSPYVHPERGPAIEKLIEETTQYLLKRRSAGHLRALGLEEDVINKINILHRSATAQARRGASMWDNYVQVLPEYILKFAAVRAIDRDDLTITMEDLNIAEALLTPIVKRMKVHIDKIGISRPVIQGTSRGRLLATLKDREEMTKTEIRRAFSSVKTNQVDSWLKELIQTGEVEVYERKEPGRPGKAPKTYRVIKEDEKDES